LDRGLQEDTLTETITVAVAVEPWAPEAGETLIFTALAEEWVFVMTYWEHHTTGAAEVALLDILTGVAAVDQAVVVPEQLLLLPWVVMA
jgi:hypothetical protein